MLNAKKTTGTESLAKVSTNFCDFLPLGMESENEGLLLRILALVALAVEEVRATAHLWVAGAGREGSMLELGN